MAAGGSSSDSVKLALWEGATRLNYRTSANAAFYETLSRHVKAISKRGCHTTAFTMARMLFSFDPLGDPMALLLSLDYYAIVAKAYTFVLTLVEDASEVTIGPNRHAPVTEATVQAQVSATSSRGGVVGSSTHASWPSHGTKTPEKPVTVVDLPNFAYSAGLALYWLGREEEATQQFATAMLSFPALLKQLLVAVKVDLLSEPWKSLLDTGLFRDSYVHHDTLDHLYFLYVERSAVLFENKSIQRVLEKGAHQALDRVSDSKRMAQRLTKIFGVSTSQVHKYLNVTSADLMDDTEMLPEDDPMMEEDPMHNMLPAPVQEEAPLEAQEPPPRPDDVVQENEEDLDMNAHPALLFLQSLLPWNTMPTNDTAR